MKWMRPSGVEIETNDLPATIDFAKKLGWVEMPDKPKRKRRTKQEMQEDGNSQ